MSESDSSNNPNKPVFGVNKLEDYKEKKISKAEEERIRRNITHSSGIDTSRPIPQIPEDQRPHATFPEPKITERDGKRFTSLGIGTHLYTGPNGDKERELIGDIIDDHDSYKEGEYLERFPHPTNPKMMPSIKIGFESPINVRTPDGNIIEFKGKAYGDRRGIVWDGMPEQKQINDK